MKYVLAINLMGHHYVTDDFYITNSVGDAINFNSVRDAVEYIRNCLSSVGQRKWIQYTVLNQIRYYEVLHNERI